MSESITKYGVAARGRAELIKHEAGKRLARGQAIKAKCYECNAGYTDGRVDCLIPDCALHPYMPYKGVAPPKSGVAEDL